MEAVIRNKTYFTKRGKDVWWCTHNFCWGLFIFFSKKQFHNLSHSSLSLLATIWNDMGGQACQRKKRHREKEIQVLSCRLFPPEYCGSTNGRRQTVSLLVSSGEKHISTSGKSLVLYG
ncbi:hypothetical protein RSDT_0277 [Candidatus Desulfovibrio trichonymphae]|uniref:Uncharacterized protein n=1 Tax=Candidatus Desulfovibrio trichonymphae TaxID=1725232 RepID=A0A1J1DT02_9BACT|nr:hypothetical protein RSDT_0277 [Candidatus Desulfovibrio trichonymphae]